MFNCRTKLENYYVLVYIADAKSNTIFFTHVVVFEMGTKDASAELADIGNDKTKRLGEY